MFSLNTQSGYHAICYSVLIYLLSSHQLALLPLVSTHFIQYNHNTLHANNFPRPSLAKPPPLEQQYLSNVGSSTRELSPAELMVDLSNALAYRILHYHSILNRNNFAFSPTALMSVLISLYEGSAGRSALELRNVLQLPDNRDIIRVGYRDIHRKLRTYFFESENPLKGLSLNKDNVTISSGYEAVLMFYGYDLGMDMVSSTVSSMASSTTPMSNVTDEKEISIATTGTPKESTTTTAINTENTGNETAERSSTTTKTISATTPTPATTTLATTAKTTTQMTNAASSTRDTTTISSRNDITEALQLTSTTTITTTEDSAATTTDATTDDDTTTTTTTTTTNDAAEIVNESIAELRAAPTFERLQKARKINQPSAKLQAPPSSTTPTAPKHMYLPQYMRSRAAAAAARQKRHLIGVGGLKEVDANLFGSLFNSQPQAQLLLHQPLVGQIASDYEVETLDARLLNVANAKSNFGYNTDVISHVFYLGNQQLIHTTFKVYNAVLYFKYFVDLRMSVLELELDTPNYNLMILLPDDQIDLVSATASLGLAPPLRFMRKQLKPRWVQAIIPDFKLHGVMFLTNDLQNMGVCDIFEPNRADFRPMTDEKGIYVKHIEQSINVSIRTHPINQLKRNYGSQAQPIQISVNHPFLFFIIDRDLDVAVMAGRILNPLNVRIQ